MKYAALLLLGALAGFAVNNFACRPEPPTTKIKYVTREVPKIVEKIRGVPVPERITVYKTITKVDTVCFGVPVMDRARVGVIPISLETNTPVLRVEPTFVEVPVWDPEALRFRSFRYGIKQRKVNGLYIGAGAVMNESGFFPGIAASYDWHWWRLRASGSAVLTLDPRESAAFATVGVRL